MPDRNQNVHWPGWTVGGPIGRGSFGTVYKISRDVYGYVEEAALKVITIPRDDSEVDLLLYAGVNQESITQTFENKVGDIAREYQLMRQLGDNPNIVHCDDFRSVQHSDGPGWDIFIKMELLTPLLRAPREQLSSETQIIQFGKDMCNAIAACQKLDIIHRDIKPQNIFVAKNGSYKLGDFGIARTMEKTTHATAGVGTYSYMAPEVARNEAYGKTADIYSLGLILYWLLNERRGPFLPLPPAVVRTEDTENAWRRRFGGEKIPLPKHGSEGLKAVVMKACAFKPKDRFQTAEEMLAALERSSAGGTGIVPEKRDPQAQDNDQQDTVIQGGGERRDKEKKRTAKLAVVLAAAVLLLVGIVGYFSVHIWTDATCTDPEICVLCGEQRSDAAGHQWEAADCTTAKTCRVCGKTKGDAAGHEWMEATCQDPMTCAVCGETKGAVADHVWRDATCESPMTCTVCGEVKGTEADHIWSNATCEDPMTCSVCGATTGAKLGHQWRDASCETPQTCTRCGATGAAAVGHTWLDATVYEPKICTVCGETSGEPLLGMSELGIPMCGMIAAGNFHSVYLSPSGTVNAEGLASLSDQYANKGGRCDTGTWYDIIAIDAASHTVGLRADGTVVAIGINEHGQCDVEDWTNIVAIEAGNNHTVGLRKDGTVVAQGKNDHGQCDVSSWRNIVDIAVCDETTFGLTEDGRVLAVGDKHYGSGWSNIIAISGGTEFLVGLKADGTVVHAGVSEKWNEGTQDWTDIVAISAGSAHIVGLRKDGTVVACGAPNNMMGQCDVGSWTGIVAISAGMHHTIGLKLDGTIVAVGNDTYGQLRIANGSGG